MKHEVVVTGIGIHPFGRWPDKSTIQLSEVAIRQALADACITFPQVQAAWLGAEFAGFTEARQIVQHFGWTGIPISQMQQACASGSAAFREAYLAVQSGCYDTVLVLGYEKMEGGLLSGGDPALDHEFHLHHMGLDVTPGRIAMALQRRMLAYGETPQMLAAEAVQCYAYGAKNPNAKNRKAFTHEEILAAPVICSPLTKYMCCPSTDGAAAVVITTRAKAQQHGSVSRSITILGHGVGSPSDEDLLGGPGPHIGGDFRAGSLTHRVGGLAYEAAGVGPQDVDVVQCHAPFAGGGFVCAEALGFCDEGEGGRFFLEGKAALDGQVAFNTDGGLLARGHPLGATGIAEIYELVRQLRGEAGELQMPRRPKIAVAHNTGLGCLNMHILGR
ncbi:MULTISPECIES: thiolase family protein [Cupriavidus]|uniref:propanoyl-CoA C-acyltransferase n=2 Tax=Cupriavidus TaxID=106589 RepID=A0A7W4YSJ5_9BURK|nr:MULTISPECIES: thiolase family protein [Cupriavidus]MBB3009900.1 acetyl-CoA acetyltransferase [Cupriavidus alkaliphilus]QBY56225.1 thiolase family protein [Cupriavidus oxalaticus]